MITDRTYQQALLDTADGPHTVLLGPVECIRCSAWVEWAGAAWLALGTREPHNCEPFMAAGRTWRSRPEDQAHPMVPARIYPEASWVAIHTATSRPRLTTQRVALAVAALVLLALVLRFGPW